MWRIRSRTVVRLGFEIGTSKITARRFDRFFFLFLSFFFFKVRLRLKVFQFFFRLRSRKVRSLIRSLRKNCSLGLFLSRLEL